MYPNKSDTPTETQHLSEEVDEDNFDEEFDYVVFGGSSDADISIQKKGYDLWVEQGEPEITSDPSTWIEVDDSVYMNQCDYNPSSRSIEFNFKYTDIPSTVELSNYADLFYEEYGVPVENVHLVNGTGNITETSKGFYFDTIIDGMEDVYVRVSDIGYSKKLTENKRHSAMSESAP